MILLSKESGLFYRATKNTPKDKSNKPCPTSPNISPNKNGKEITVNKPGLHSPYLGIP